MSNLFFKSTTDLSRLSTIRYTRLRNLSVPVNPSSVQSISLSEGAANSIANLEVSTPTRLMTSIGDMIPGRVHKSIHGIRVSFGFPLAFGTGGTYKLFHILQR